MTGEGINGGVHIYRRGRQGFAHEALLQALSREAFGESLLVAGDTVFVGAREAKTRLDQRSRPMQPLEQGAVYAFQRVAGQWDVTQVLRPSILQARAAGNACFGESLAFGDGVLAVSAWGEISGDPEQPKQGSLYLFEKRGRMWEQTARLRAPAGHNRGVFGGDSALAGGWLATTGDKGVYLFERKGRDRWVLRHVLAGGGRLVMGREWLVMAAGDYNEATGHDWLRLFRRQGQRWVGVARAAIPPPPVATRHYGSKMRFDSFVPALASDGRWVAVSVRVHVDNRFAPRVRDPKYDYVSGVALYEIVPQR